MAEKKEQYFIRLKIMTTKKSEVCILFSLLLTVAWTSNANAQGCDGPRPKYVFSSSPREMNAPTSGYWQDGSALNVFSDVAAINSGFDESDVVLQRTNGSTTTIKNCTNSAENCAAQEARVSPSGRRIAYSVSYGPLLRDENTLLWHLGDITNAKIYIYDIATNTSVVVPNQSATVINRMPDWIDDTTLVYASNAANLYPVRDQFNCHGGKYPDGAPRGYNNGECVSQSYPYSSAGKAMQIWRMKTDGSQQTNLTPQEMNAIRPTVLRHPKNKGRIAYSSWQAAEDEAFYQGSDGPGTVVNLWWLMTIAADGTAPQALIGAHHSGDINKEAPQSNFQQLDQLMAVRSVGEDTQGRLHFTNYYRGNHMGGLGTIYRMNIPLGDFQVEGCSTQNCYVKTISPSNSPGSGQYVPPDLQAVSPFGVGSDDNQNIDDRGRAVGVTGYPSYMANGHILATWGKGWCYNQSGDAPNPFNGTPNSIGYEPICDMQIVEFLVDKVTDPHDPAQMTVLVGDATKHTFDASEITTKPIVVLPSPLNAANGCYLEVVDLRNAELYPADPTFDWRYRSALVGVQGNSVKPHDPLFHKKNVKSLAIYGTQQHTTMYPDSKFVNAVNYTGYEDVWLIGKQDMQADGSLKMKVPCEQSFSMAALDSTGKWITHDPMLHSLRSGETRTCHGCHDGHSVERQTDLGSTPQARFSTTLSATTTPQLLTGKAKVSFAEVQPILTNACSGCHTGFQNDSLLWSRVFADQQQLDFAWMKKMQSGNGNTLLPRPYYSGLVARYARWSPLVWVMEGRRLDGYSNSDYTNDQDFPMAHPAVTVTPDQIKKVVDYIQLGAPRP